MKIEEIKHNFNVSKVGIAKLDEVGMGQHVMSMQREYVDHVEYLLSKLEQASESLAQIKYDYEQSSDPKVVNRMYEEAKEALKQIKED